MPKFLFEASYTAEGARGLLKDGGSGRKAAIEDLVTGLGGSLESLYFAFGGDDVFAVAELPDHESAVAASMTASGSGMVNVRTVVLLSAEQVDAAVKKRVNYRRPGS